MTGNASVIALPGLTHLDLPPLLRASGSVRLPGSKSISNRVLLLAALGSGQCVVKNLLRSDDTEVMLAALRQLGCSVDEVDGSALHIGGLGGRLPVAEGRLFLGNSGTSMRSLTAAVAVLATVHGGTYELCGVPRMHARPIADLVDALRALGCPVSYSGQAGCPPLRVGDGRVHALQTDVPIRVSGAISSQFLTGLLLAAPLMAASQDVVVEVAGALISRPYVAITLDWLARFGVTVRNDGWQRFTVPAGSRLQSPATAVVEGDASSASYFIALGAIAADRAAPVCIEGVGARSVQGDVRFVDAASAMGADVDLLPDAIHVWRGRWPLTAIDRDCNDMPDAAMTLAVMALYARGTTRLTNIASWRVKETDRIAAMAAELQKLGAVVDTGDDWIAITPPVTWRAAAIATYDDHRMAMCLSLAAFNGLALQADAANRSVAVHPTVPAQVPVSVPVSAQMPVPVPVPVPVPIRILDPHCVAKTFPGYFDTLFAVATTDPVLVPVITIDGPTASGKGTVASAVARRLGWHVLDSGALYRATALEALRAGVTADDEPALAALAETLPLRFDSDRILLRDDDVTLALRDEAVGARASAISAHPRVRTALVALQLSFRRPPGLVADGRDMGTAIFRDAPLKIFLTASAALRAERRHAQLQARGVSASIDDLQAAMEARDRADRNRKASPLTPAPGAQLLDSSSVTVGEAVEAVLAQWEARQPFSPSPH